MASTFLRQAISPTDTIIPVGSTVTFGAITTPIIISIDSGSLLEFVRVSQSNATEFLVATDGAGGRGYGGTSPVAHHPNVAIGLSSGSGTPGVPYVLAPLFNFSPITPGVDLTAGVPATLSIQLPPGVNSTDINHYLYVSGGSGIPEAVKLTAITGSGGGSGTITFTPANNHSGAWTLSSATAGAQEAHNATPGAEILFPSGTYDFYGPLWSNGNLGVKGANIAGTLLRFNSLTLKMFDIERDWFTISDMKLLQVGTPIAGNVGIFTAAAGSSLSGAAANNGFLERLWIVGFWNGIKNDGGGGSVNLSDITVNDCLNDGIVSLRAQGYWSKVIGVHNAGNAFTFGTASGGGGGATAFLSGVQTYNNGGWGLHATVPVAIGGEYNFFNNDFLGEVYLGFAGVNVAAVTNAALQFAGQSISWGINTAAPSMVIDTGVLYYTLTNLQFLTSQGTHLKINGSTAVIEVADSTFLSPGQGGVAGNLYAIDAPASAPNIYVNNTISGPVRIGGSQNKFRNNSVNSSGTLATLEIASGSGVTFDGNSITQAGGGNAITIGAGTTLLPGANDVAGPITNAGVYSAQAVTIIPFRATALIISTETGANNAIIGSLTGVALADGLCILQKLSHSLQAGVNTYNFNGGGALSIKRHTNPTADLATAYTSNGYILLCYNGGAAAWMDMSQ